MTHSFVFWLYILPLALEMTCWGLYMTVDGVTSLRVLSMLVVSLTPGLNILSLVIALISTIKEAP